MTHTKWIFKILLLSFIYSLHAQNPSDRMENIPQMLSAENLLLKGYMDSVKKYEQLGKRKEALAFFKIYTLKKDSIMAAESQTLKADLNDLYETEKKENEIKLLLKNKLFKEKEIAKQKVIQRMVMIGIGIIFLLSLLLLGRYRLIRKLNNKLKLQNELVVNKNNLILDSIDYAQRIQQSILPAPELLNSFFKDSFIIYKPKDIVSGDIYWFREKTGQLWLSAVDCTGHGVPGAMMSIVAYDLLHQAVRLNKIEAPDEILKSINKGIQLFSNSLNDSNKINDGMDIAMCQIDLSTLLLRYAGAKNSVYIVRDNNLTVLDADKVSIGLPDYYEFNFTAHTFQLKKGDMLYLFTDGFADQKGGPNNRKYYVEPFKNLLLANSSLSCSEQQKAIEQTLKDWIKEWEQVDDILIIGVSV